MADSQRPYQFGTGVPDAYAEALRTLTTPVPKCEDCGRSFFYARYACPYCHSLRVKCADLQNGWRVRARTWVWRQHSSAFEMETPTLMVAITNGEVSVLAQAIGWSYERPPQIGETVQYKVLNRHKTHIPFVMPSNTRQRDRA